MEDTKETILMIIKSIREHSEWNFIKEHCDRIEKYVKETSG